MMKTRTFNRFNFIDDTGNFVIDAPKRKEVIPIESLRGEDGLIDLSELGLNLRISNPTLIRRFYLGMYGPSEFRFRNKDHLDLSLDNVMINSWSSAKRVFEYRCQNSDSMTTEELKLYEILDSREFRSSVKQYANPKYGRALIYRVTSQACFAADESFYLADFLIECADYKLIIEADGSHHYTEDGYKYDKIRDDFISKFYNVRILRFENFLIRDLSSDQLASIILKELVSLTQANIRYANQNASLHTAEIAASLLDPIVLPVESLTPISVVRAVRDLSFVHGLIYVLSHDKIKFVACQSINVSGRTKFIHKLNSPSVKLSVGGIYRIKSEWLNSIDK